MFGTGDLVAKITPQGRKALLEILYFLCLHNFPVVNAGQIADEYTGPDPANKSKIYIIIINITRHEPPTVLSLLYVLNPGLSVITYQPLTERMIFINFAQFLLSPKV